MIVLIHVGTLTSWPPIIVLSYKWMLTKKAGREGPESSCPFELFSNFIALRKLKIPRWSGLSLAVV
jgi:hypothetical protein